MLVGDANHTAFVECDFEGLYANGSTLRTDVPGLDLPNHCISIHGNTGGTMEYTFSDCDIEDNRGETVVYQSGGRGSWSACNFLDNVANTNFSGVVTLLSCNPTFSNCVFAENESGYGTVFFDGTGVSSLDGLRFVECDFLDNETIDGRWGGVIFAQDSNAANGTAPKLMFDDCEMDGNNGNVGVDQDDFVSPYFPSYRQGDSNEEALVGSEGDADGDASCTPSADLNGDGIVDGNDLGMMFSLWGTDGNL